MNSAPMICSILGTSCKNETASMNVKIGSIVLMIAARDAPSFCVPIKSPNKGIVVLKRLKPTNIHQTDGG